MKLEEILAPVSRDLEAVEACLRDWAEDELPVASEVIGHIVGSGGKRIRPACLLLAAGLAEEGRPSAAGARLGRCGPAPNRSIELAAAIEIIHTASLVHDDIVDGAPVRRGTETVHARWGQSIALLVGDLLYSRLLRSLTEGGQEEALRCVAEAIHRMVQGELVETVRRNDLTLGESEYFEIVGNKTSALFSCATYLGAHYGGLAPEECARLRQYGEHLGNAFQIADDLLDICEDARVLGKPAGADLLDGKMTLPVIHALEQDRRRGRELISKLFLEKEKTELLKEIHQSGSLAYAAKRAEEAAEEAVSHLKGLSLPAESPCLRGLVGMARYAFSRGREALARLPVYDEPA